MNQAQAEKKVAKEYTKAGGKNAKAIPWDMVIEILMKLFEGCTTQRAQEFCEEHPVAATFLAKGALKDEYEFSGYGNKELTLIAKAGVAAFVSAGNGIDDLR
jgi:hypothetical protein